jgi:nitrile hydratase
MLGVHDLGGQQGFGPVAVEQDEPVWHDAWEGRMFALMGAVGMQGWLGGPTFRHGIERMDPGHYLTSSYYEHWFTSVATLLVEQGRIDRDALEHRAGGVVPLSLALTADPTQVDPEPVAPRLRPGDRVRVRRLGFPGHTRCPGFVMGRAGTVVRDDGPANVPEVEGHLGELVQEHVYSVRFAATELWPESTDDQAVVHVDLYERYLDPMEP